MFFPLSGGIYYNILKEAALKTTTDITYTETVWFNSKVIRRVPTMQMELHTLKTP